MTDLTMFVPSRGRPSQARELQKAFDETCTAHTEVIFVVSTDDPDWKFYNHFHLEQRSLKKVISVTPDRRGMAAPLNMGFRKWLNDPRVFPSYAVGFMGDDHRPRTVGWDQAYLETLTALSGRCRNRAKPGVGMVYGNDLLQGRDLPTQVAMTTNIPATLERMVPDELAHLYTDTYWLELGSRLGRIQYLPDVIVEHMHPGAGKARVDEGYEYSGNFSLDQSDKNIFEGVIKEVVLPLDVERIKRLM